MVNHGLKMSKHSFLPISGRFCELFTKIVFLSAILLDGFHKNRYIGVLMNTICPNSFAAITRGRNPRNISGIMSVIKGEYVMLL